VTAQSGAYSNVYLRHKIDVDPIEDGCLVSVDLNLQLHPQGCFLNLDFSIDSAGVGRLTELSFSADSYCPGFLDSEEGFYSMGDWDNDIDGFEGQVATWVQGLPITVPDAQSDASCLENITLSFADIDIPLWSFNDERVWANLSNLTLHGSPISYGDTSNTCYAYAECYSSYHDGGNGLCYDTSYCTEGFYLGSGGNCIAGTEPEPEPSPEPEPEPTGEWTCSTNYFGTGDGCDCGCGIVDTDCANTDISTCEYFGNCGDAASVDPDDTTRCL